MDTLQTILSDIRVFLYSGVQNLPLSMAGTMLLLGLFTANYAMLFFLVGLLLVVPFTNLMLDKLLQILLPESFRVRTGDVCSVLVPFLSSSNSSSNSSTNSATGANNEYHILSQWTAMVAFFFGYMSRNAIKLLTREPEPTGAIEVTEKQVKELDRKASYRRVQAIVSAFSIAVVALVLFLLRFNTGCESPVGFFLGLVGFGASGYFWYDILSSIGQDRLSDLFGIANRLLSPGAIANGPVVCLPVPE
jgi:uncharacterized membrane protein